MTDALPRAARQTPAWLLSGGAGLCPCGRAGVRRRGRFVEKTLGGGAAVLRQAMFSDDVATERGLLQRVEPRVKLLTVVGLLVAVGLVHSVPVLLGCYAGTLALAAASRVPVVFFVRRVWLFVPLFTGIVVLPATLSVVTPGDLVLTLWHWHGQPVGFTAQGLSAAGLVVARVATSISLVVLLTLTTPWSRLLAALRALGVPRIFVLVIGMAYRYLFLLLTAVTDMYTARKARAVGAGRNARSAAEGRRFVAASAGALFGKAHQLSEEVHQAMTARGYRGEARALAGTRPGALDAAWTVAAVLLAAAVLVVDRRWGS
jgi:cobalt/nickel transport system permease protein